MQSARLGDQYVTRHNPFVYFHSIIDRPTCARNDVDYRLLAADVRGPASTPSFAVISPNLCNDGHDAPCVDGRPGGLRSADAWLRRELPKLLSSPGFKDDGLLVVTFDEARGDSSACCGELPGPNTSSPGGAGPGGGRVGAVLISPFIRPGTLAFGAYNHFVAVSPDHVLHVPGAVEWRSLFQASAILLAVIECAGVFVGAWALDVARRDAASATPGRGVSWV
jgi:hypothetical protein